MKKFIQKALGIIIILVGIAICYIHDYTKVGEASMVSSSSIINNTKIGWGIKRANNNMQPELRKNKHGING